MKYTKEQKKKYFNDLREKWNESKKLSMDKKTELEAVIKEAGLSCSFTSFYFVKQEMENNNYDGIPYVDCKVYPKLYKLFHKSQVEEIKN